MTSLISGGIGLIGGLFGMGSGLRQAKQPGSGIAPLMYMISGQEEQAAARSEASMLAKQGALAYEDALINAEKKRREYTAFREQQALDFASGGVTLQGSPLGVLQETTSLGEQEVNAITRRGQAVSDLYQQQGLQMLRRGSAAAFSGFAQALQSQAQTRAQQSAMRDQAFQTGLGGIQAGVEGLGSLFGGGRGGGFMSGFGRLFSRQPSFGAASSAPFGRSSFLISDWNSY